MLVNIISFKLPKSSIIVQSDFMTYRLIVASLFRFIRLTDWDIKALLFRFIRLKAGILCLHYSDLSG